jgi:MFS family permease
MWYCRHEIQFRQALFFSAASIAGAFSGLLAFGIAKMDGVGGLEGWRWIFILEGIVTVLVAIFAFWALYDFPETASFLTEEERAFVVFRLKYQGQQKAAGQSQSRVAQADEFKWEYVWAAFKDWQIWVNIFVYWGVSQDMSCHNVSNANHDRLSAHYTALAFSCPPSFATLATVPARPSL